MAEDTLRPGMSDDEAVEVLYRGALRELEDGDPEAAENPLSQGDHERVREYLKTGYRPGMGAEQAAALQEAAVQDLLRALEFGPGGTVEALRREIRGLGEVIAQIGQARQAGAGVS
jgi:hypothetical protein